MQQMQQASRPMNTMAVISLATGIGSWFLLPLVGGLVAVITGHIAKSQIRRTGEDGGTFATIGLVLGYLHLAVVGLVLLLVVLIVFGGLAFFIGSGGLHTTTPTPVPTG